jgi:hypothetical protein
MNRLTGDKNAVSVSEFKHARPRPAPAPPPLTLEVLGQALFA